MWIGAHVLLYSDNPEADRAFFRDVPQLPAVDSGGVWLIFKLPTAEAGVHPNVPSHTTEVFLQTRAPIERLS